MDAGRANWGASGGPARATWVATRSTGAPRPHGALQRGPAGCLVPASQRHRVQELSSSAASTILCSGVQTFARCASRWGQLISTRKCPRRAPGGRGGPDDCERARSGPSRPCRWPLLRPCALSHAGELVAPRRPAGLHHATLPGTPAPSTAALPAHAVARQPAVPGRRGTARAPAPFCPAAGHRRRRPRPPRLPAASLPAAGSSHAACACGHQEGPGHCVVERRLEVQLRHHAQGVCSQSCGSGAAPGRSAALGWVDW